MALRKPVAKKQTLYQADIIFCLDVTGSMQPCINGIKSNIQKFSEQVQREGMTDLRMGLIAYRDRHDTSQLPGHRWPANEEPWFFSPDFFSDKNRLAPDKVGLTSSTDEFRGWLNVEGYCEAYGGGEEANGAESSLDALYYALRKGDWRTDKTYKVIVLLTDADTHPSLAKTTITRGRNDLEKLIQDFATRMPHGCLFICAPRYPTYEELVRKVEKSSRKVFYYPVPNGQGLSSVNFGDLMHFISNSITASMSDMSIRIGRE